MMSSVLKVVLLAMTAAAFAALPSCASHNELKAPCSADATSILFSQAYASGVDDHCGPMVRQLSVIVNDDPNATANGDRDDVTVF